MSQETTAISILPWAYPYLVGTVAAATTLILLSQRLTWCPIHIDGVPLPPGPPAKWLWENPFPEHDVARKLAMFVEQYGPVISLRSGSHVTIVIGRTDAATEIMEKQGAVLVDRPRQVAAAELYSGGMSILFESGGDRFRRFRRAIRTHLQPKAVEMCQEVQSEAAKEVILDILDDPKQHMEHAQRYAAAVILRVTYGKGLPTSNDDPEVVRIHQGSKNFATISKPGRYLVDRIPWLKYVPGYGRELRKFHQYDLALFRDQLDRVRCDMAKNIAGPSFGKTLLEHTGDHGLSDDEMAYLAGSLFGAGADTTAAGITLMIMAAACYPDAQAHVQEELDKIVGRDRVPTFGDKDKLPQLHAFMLETLRWRPVTPLGFEHRAMKDIVWKGQCIPAGASVLGCHWAISRDPVVFPDPETFDPRRWLTKDGRVKADMQFCTYGFGRRVCPGQHIANRSLYINLAMLLWSFRIMQRPGAPITHDESGFLNPPIFCPKPFEVEFLPRMEEAHLRKLIVNSLIPGPCIR